MPNCPQCSLAITCPGHAHVLGSSSQPCPLQRGAVWIWVVDHGDNGVENARVSFDGAEKLTDTAGVASFDPVNTRVDPYPVEVLVVPGSHEKSHRLPDLATGAVTVAQGQIVTHKFALPQRKPKIEVIDRHDFKKVVGDSEPYALAVKNVGDGDLTLTTITFPPLFVAHSTNTVVDGAVVAPNATVELKLQFKPTADGPQTGDLLIASNDTTASPKTVTLLGERVTPTLELFRAASVLDVVPFATTDVAANLDAPLPDTDHHAVQPSRDSSLDAQFKFPLKTEYATHAHADADPSVFRLRLKNMPDGLPPDDIEVVLKVTTPADALLGQNGGTFANTACHKDGMKVDFRKNGGVWESPYMRVATTVTDVSKDDTRAIVHSPRLTLCKAMADGVQFGRKLKATVKVAGKDVAGTFIMGGTPWARVPVQFSAIGCKASSARPWNKLAELNQYWAGQGVEFVMKTPLKALHELPFPERRLLTINEHSGAALVSNHDFRLDLGLTFTIGSDVTPVAVTVDVPAGQTSLQVAQLIVGALTTWRGSGSASAVRLGADVNDFPAPRIRVRPPPGTTAFALTPVGVRGPTDVTLKETSGATLTDFAFTSVVATYEKVVQPPPSTTPSTTPVLPIITREPDLTVDVFAPPLNHPFHDPASSPPAAPMRAWVRAFGPSTGDYVSVLLSEDRKERHLADLHHSGLSTLYDATPDTVKGRMHSELQAATSTSSPISILNFGRWDETCARFVIFLFDSNFSANSNDLQHEMGHTLCDLDHTTAEPDWFYRYELMHASGPAEGKANQMTRHKVVVDTVVDESGWKARYVTLADGYGGAARARIGTLASGWRVTTGGPGYPWT